MRVLLLILGAIVIVGIASALNGWALSIMWGWFIVPVFNLPQLSIVQAVGVGIIISYTTKVVDYKGDDKKDQHEELARTLFSAIVKPFVFLSIGWIVTLFIH